MTIQEYFNDLQELLATYPEAKDYEVIFSIDDEGNSFNRACYPPSIGKYEGSDFISKGSFDEYDVDDSEANAICLN
jgi:hypothetical protein